MENNNQPATKQDVEQLRSEFQHGFDELKETMRDGQTELLRAFYGFAESTQVRFKASDESEANMKKRLGIIEERITELERRVITPRPQ
jgi:hypothetical protein